MNPEALAALEPELTVIPAIPSLAILVLAMLRTAEGFAFQPETEGVAGLIPVALALRYVFEVVLTSLILFTVIYALLFAVFVYLLNDKITHGPDQADLIPSGVVRWSEETIGQILVRSLRLFAASLGGSPA